jgi:phosphinothricin acetyltransferase
MPLNSCLVRPAEESDFAAITRIYTHYVLHHTATFEIDPPDRSAMLARHAVIAGLGLPYLVGEAQGQVVAYAYASAYRPRPAYRFTIEDSIYVDAAHTGRGFGRILLEALLEICGKGSWRQVVAVIGDSGNIASVRLHQHFGFRHVGTLEAVGFKFDRWLDTVIMQKYIGDTS